MVTEVCENSLNIRKATISDSESSFFDEKIRMSVTIDLVRQNFLKINIVKFC